MAIRLRQSTQKDQQASGASFGLGLDHGDGGTRAIQGALGQVGQAAGQLARQREALENQGVADAQNVYATEVAATSARAKKASIDEDINGYNAAMAEMEKLKGAPLNAFMPVKDRDLKISEGKWQSAQLVADKGYGASRNSLDIATTTTQYAAKFSRKVKEVGDTSSLLISEGNVGPGGIMETDARSNALVTGDLATGATPKSMKALELEMTRYASNSIKAFGASKDKYTSFERFNKDVDIIKDIYSKGAAYGKYKGLLMKSVEALRIKPTAGSKTGIPTAATSAMDAVDTASETEIHVAQSDRDLQVSVQEEYSDPATNTASALDTTASLAVVNPVRQMLSEPSTRVDMAEWAADNPGLTGSDYLALFHKQFPIGTALPTDRRNTIKIADNILKYMREVPLETSQRSEEGNSLLNATAVASATSPENEALIKYATSKQHTAVETFDLSTPEAVAPLIEEMKEGYAPILSTDFDKEHFVGKNQFVESLEKSPRSGRNYVANISVAQRLWGQERTSMFLANHNSDTSSPAENRLAAGLGYNTYFKEDGDVKDLEYISAGMQEREWKNSAEGERLKTVYTNWESYSQSDSSKVSEIYQNLHTADTADAQWVRDFITGFAISKLGDDPTLDPETIDDQAAGIINERFQFHEAYGNVSIQNRSRMADGNWAEGMSSWGTQLFVDAITFPDMLNPFTTGEGAAKTRDYVQGIGGTSLSSTDYAEGRINRAVLSTFSSDILKYNIQSFGIADSTINKLSPPEDRLLDMMYNGKARLTRAIMKDGKAGYALEVFTEDRRDRSGVFQRLFGKGDIRKTEWEALVGADGKAHLIAASAVDVNYSEFDTDQAELRSRYWKNIGNKALVTLGEGASRVSDKRTGKHELSPFGESVKSFFSDLF